MMIISLTIKGTFLLIVAWLATSAMKNRSPAERYSLWAFVFAALLLLPVLIQALPQWNLIDDSNSGFFASQQPEFHSELMPTSRIQSNEPSTEIGLSEKHWGFRTETKTAKENVATSPNLVVPPPRSQSIQPATNMVPVGTTNFVAKLFSRYLIGCLTAVWAIGFCVIAFRLILSSILLRRMERQCRSVRCDVNAFGSDRVQTDTADCVLDPELAVVVETAIQIAQEMKLVRRFSLIFADSEITPFVWGELKSRIVLPSNAHTWNEAKVRSVLAHELAHIKRNDPFSHSLVQLATAIHWINPLIWIAAHRINLERELACDDRVLQHGIRPNAYAKHLLEISMSTSRQQQSAGMVAMTRQSGLRSRMERVLAKKNNRQGATLANTLIGLLVTFSIAVPVSMAALTPRAVQERDFDMETSNDESAAEAKKLFHAWWSSRRIPDSDNIPWGLVNLLGDEIDQWVAKHADSKQLQPIQHQGLLELSALTKRKRDWTPNEARALVDQVSRLAIEPVKAATSNIKLVKGNIFNRGRTHRNNSGADRLVWSKAADNGLRIGISLDNSDATRKYLPGSSWQRLLWLHNTSDTTLLVSTPLNIPIESLNISVEDSDGNQLQIIRNNSNGSQPKNKSNQDYHLGPNEKCVLTMEKIMLGRPGTTVEEAVSPYIDVSKPTKIRMTFRPELPLGNNPLVSGPNYSLASRHAFYKTLLHQLLPTKGDAPKMDAKFLARAAGISNDSALINEIDALIKNGEYDDAIAVLAKQKTSVPFSGNLPEFNVELSIEPVTQAEGEKELEKLFDELYEWDRDRRARIVAASEAGQKDEMMAVLNEDIPYPRFGRMMYLAEAWPKSETAMEASLLTMKATYASERDIAMEVLVNHHAESSRIAEAMPFTLYTSARTTWARNILKVNNSPVVMAHAKWAMGPDLPHGHEAEPGDAIDFYTGIIRDFGSMEKYRGYWGVPQPRKTFGELASREIQKIKAKSKWAVGKKLPAFEGIDLDGKAVSLADFQGKTTLIVYWTTWCGPCLQMAQMEKRMLKRYEDKSFAILGVCGDFTSAENDESELDAFAEEVREKAAQHGITWRSIRNTLDNGELVSDLLGFPSLPYTILVDGDGIVRSTNFVNGTTNDPVSQEKWMMAEIEKVLGGKFDTAKHLTKVERQVQAIDAYRRVQPRLVKIEASVKEGKFDQVNDQLKQIMDDDSAPLLKPCMLNRVIWTLYLTHQQEPLPKNVLATLLAGAEMADKDQPNDTYLLGTLAHVAHANGDLNRAIEVLKKAIKHADEESVVHTKAALEKFTQEIETQK